LAGQHLQPDTTGGEVVDGVDQVAQVPAEPVELQHHQRVALSPRLEAGGETGPVCAVPVGDPVGASPTQA